MRVTLPQLLALVALVALFTGFVLGLHQQGAAARFSWARFLDDQYLAVCHGERVRLWRVGSQIEQTPIRFPISRDWLPGSNIWALSDGTVIIRDDQLRDARLVQYDLRTRKKLRSRSVPKVSVVTVSGDGNTIAYAQAGRVGAMDWTGRPKWIPVQLDWSDSICLSPDGSKLAVCQSGELSIWDTDVGRPLAVAEFGPPDWEQAHPSYAIELNPDVYRWSLRFSPDGRYVVAWNARARVYRAADLDLLFTVEPDHTINHRTPWMICRWRNAPRDDEMQLCVHRQDWSRWYKSEPGPCFVERYVACTGELTWESGPKATPTRAYLEDGSPDGRWIVARSANKLEAIKLPEGRTTTIIRTQPKLLPSLYFLGFVAWGVAYGWIRRRESPSSAESLAFPPPDTLLSLAILGFTTLFAWGVVQEVAVALLFLVALLFPLVVWGIHWWTRCDAPEAMRIVWTGSAFGGAAAIAIPIYWLNESGFIYQPFWYFAIVLGGFLIAQSVARSTKHAGRIAGMQLACLLGGDLLNFAIGGISLALLRRDSVGLYRARRFLTENPDPNEQRTPSLEQDPA